MYLLRRLFRLSFAGQTVFFLSLAVRILWKQGVIDDMPSFLQGLALPTGFLVLAVIFGTAWLRTRKASNVPQWWAVLACALHLVFRGIAFAAHYKQDGEAMMIQAIDIATPFLDIGGMIFFSRGRVPSHSSATGYELPHSLRSRPSASRPTAKLTTRHS